MHSANDVDPAPVQHLVGLNPIKSQVFIQKFCGIAIKCDGDFSNFLVIKCPCGISAVYPINGIPVIDTPHPCGNPDHWSIRYFRESNARITGQAQPAPSASPNTNEKDIS